MHLRSATHTLAPLGALSAQIPTPDFRTCSPVPLNLGSSLLVLKQGLESELNVSKPPNVFCDRPNFTRIDLGFTPGTDNLLASPPRVIKWLQCLLRRDCPPIVPIPRQARLGHVIVCNWGDPIPLRTLRGTFLRRIVGLFVRKHAESQQRLVTLSPGIRARCDS